MQILRAASLLVLAGCAVVPREELGAYQEAYALARSSARDLVLSARLAAREASADPASGRTVEERVAALKERLDALGARLAALDVVDAYNLVLVRLAEGADPEEIRGSLQALGETLGTFVSGASRVMAKAVPYLDMLSEALAFIDDLLRREEFRKAVEAAEKPLGGILKILIEDAPDLHAVEVQRLKIRLTAPHERVAELRFRMLALLKTLKTSTPVQTAIDAFNRVLQTIELEGGIRPPPCVHQSDDSARDADATTLEALASLREALERTAGEAKRLQQEITAHARLVEDHVKVLASVQTAFHTLRVATGGNSRTLLRGFTEDALRFRELALAYQEARRR